MPRANPQQDKKYYSYDPRQTHSDFHNKIGPEADFPSVGWRSEDRLTVQRESALGRYQAGGEPPPFAKPRRSPRARAATKATNYQQK